MRFHRRRARGRRRAPRSTSIGNPAREMLVTVGAGEEASTCSGRARAWHGTVRGRRCQRRGEPSPRAGRAYPSAEDLGLIASGGGARGRGLLPFPRKQFVGPVRWVLGEAREHVGEPRLRVDVVHLGRRVSLFQQPARRAKRKAGLAAKSITLYSAVPRRSAATLRPWWMTHAPVGCLSTSVFLK